MSPELYFFLDLKLKFRKVAADGGKCDMCGDEIFLNMWTMDLWVEMWDKSKEKIQESVVKVCGSCHDAMLKERKEW
jgi:hypothetical protein